jgi:peptidoglycan/LPS O-acetylase OafA/YrhL
MIGYLRYVLAALVLYSHLNFPYWSIFGVKINQGVAAVFCFYLLSGFFSAVIVDRYCGEHRLRNYYIDRTLRI